MYFLKAMADDDEKSILGGNLSWHIPSTPGPVGSAFVWPTSDDDFISGMLKKSQSTPSLFSMITSPLPTRSSIELPTYQEDVNDDDDDDDNDEAWQKRGLTWKSQATLPVLKNIL